MGAAREHGLIDRLNTARGLHVIADTPTRVAGPRPRFRSAHTQRYRRLSRAQKQVNAAHTRLRGPGERAGLQLKSWHILRKIRSCPSQSTNLIKAVTVLIQTNRNQVGKSSLPGYVGAVRSDWWRGGCRCGVPTVGVAAAAYRQDHIVSSAVTLTCVAVTMSLDLSRYSAPGTRITGSATIRDHRVSCSSVSNGEIRLSPKELHVLRRHLFSLPRIGQL